MSLSWRESSDIRVVPRRVVRIVRPAARCDPVQSANHPRCVTHDGSSAGVIGIRCRIVYTLLSAVGNRFRALRRQGAPRRHLSANCAKGKPRSSVCRESAARSVPSSRRETPRRSRSRLDAACIQRRPVRRSAGAGRRTRCGMPDAAAGARKSICCRDRKDHTRRRVQLKQRVVCDMIAIRTAGTRRMVYAS